MRDFRLNFSEPLAGVGRAGSASIWRSGRRSGNVRSVGHGCAVSWSFAFGGAKRFGVRRPQSPLSLPRRILYVGRNEIGAPAGALYGSRWQARSAPPPDCGGSKIRRAPRQGRGIPAPRRGATALPRESSTPGGGASRLARDYHPARLRRAVRCRTPAQLALAADAARSAAASRVRYHSRRGPAPLKRRSVPEDVREMCASQGTVAPCRSPVGGGRCIPPPTRVRHGAAVPYGEIHIPSINSFRHRSS
jgi:hypothetical protein